ncbi:hypothetical protein [Sulfitobacter sp. 1A15106]|uniref:hypothetical protein n=1 Tax=Sulfitobacter sp. 1A15106 TaxID=3368590 RepID=UPI003745A3DA
MNTQATRHTLVHSLFDAAHGRFIGVTFRKKNGELRKLNIQPSAVHTHLSKNPCPKALKAAYARATLHPHLMPVYDVREGRIKSINLNTVQSIRIDGIETRIA